MADKQASSKKLDQIFLVCRICDEFETQLNSGDQADIESVIEAVRDRLSPQGVDSLRADLINLRLRYSENREKVAKDLKTEYPQLSQQIELAMNLAVTADSETGASRNDQTSGNSSNGSVNVTVDDHADRGNHDANGLVEYAEISRVEIVGNYRLIRKIGEGGMGAVWLAEQTDPVRRQVALKLIKEGFASEKAIARFEIERQTLTMMNHENIAKVLDAGTSENGLPYFAMELVDGKPITQFCDNHQLSLEKRLRLFLQACDAVQHAHQKGVIHRDLKPNNLMAFFSNDEPRVKVIDFGLAKEIDRNTKLDNKTLLTKFGALLGTVRYMSPEQAALDSFDVDTRSDIYSLGVILFELLTGSTPIEKESARKLSLFQVLQSIQEDDSPRPSQRFCGWATETREVVANCRKIAPAKLKQLLCRELDWIVLRALSRDRTARYASANDLAEDIRNYLRGDAIVARPPTSAYRFRKFIQKNKAPVAAVATIFTLLAGTAIAIAGALSHANKARAEAESSSQRSELILKIVGDSFASANPNVGATVEMPAKEVLISAQNTLQESGLDDLGKIHLLWQLSHSFSGLGEYQYAVNAARQSLELSESALGPDHKDTITSMHNLANSLSKAGEIDESIGLFQKTIAARKISLGPIHPDTLASITGLATALHAGGRLQEAANSYKNAIVVSQEHFGPDDPATLGLMSRLAFIHVETRQFDDAISMFKETIKNQKRVMGPNHPGTFWSMDGLAFAYRQCGQLEEAIKLYEETFELRSARLGGDHPDTLRSTEGLANALSIVGRCDEAIELHEETLAKRIDRLGPTHVQTLWSMTSLASAHKDAGNTEEAIRLYKEALEQQLKTLGERHHASIWSMDGLANIYNDIGRTDEAIELHKKTLELRKGVFGKNHVSIVPSMHGLAAAYEENDVEKAIKLYMAAFELRKQEYGTDNRDTQHSLSKLMSALSKTRPRDSRLSDEFLDLLRSSSSDPDSTAIARLTLAAAEYRTGNFGRAIKAMEKFMDKNRNEHPGGFAILALSHMALKDVDKAMKFRAKHVEARKGSKSRDAAHADLFATEVVEVFGKFEN
jgi:serine/threonine protein kinase/lipopolysaccharide biosynthesis regulator YciM